MGDAVHVTAVGSRSRSCRGHAAASRGPLLAALLACGRAALCAASRAEAMLPHGPFGDSAMTIGIAGTLLSAASVSGYRPTGNSNMPAPADVSVAKSAGTYAVRLHRYDHSGAAAMLEAESQWQERFNFMEKLTVDVQESTVGGPRRPARRPAPGPFLQLSSRQLRALREHHRSSTAMTVAASGPQAALQTVQRHGRLHAKQWRQSSGEGLRGDILATGLSGLESQFVGPIGVGTMAVPEGCASRANVSLVFAPQGVSQAESGTASNSSAGSCHATVESQVWVVFDTGSTNMWIASDLCKSHACLKPGRSKYNHSRSLSFASVSNERIRIQFGTGSVAGPQGIDDFHVGPFTVYNQTFGMIEREEGEVFENVPFGGILGLAFPEMAANGAVPFFDNIITQSVLPANQFTFYFSMDSPSANAILWGGVDHNFHEGQIEYFNVTERWYWSLDLKGFWVGNKQLLGSFTEDPKGRSPKAIVDSGTTFFTAESGVFQQVISMLPERPCGEITRETHPDVIFMLQKSDGELRNFTFDYTQYMASWDTGSGNRCLPTFMQIDLPEAHGPGCILGEVFIRHYLTNFVRGDTATGAAKVGFARARHGEEVEEHLHSLTRGQPVFPGLQQQI